MYKENIISSYGMWKKNNKHMNEGKMDNHSWVCHLWII